MHITLVHVHVKPEYVDDFIQATRLNHGGAMREIENFRFDVIQNIDEPNRLVLYEAYTTEEAATAHKQTSYYLRWRETVANMMMEPHKGIRYNALFPRG